MNSHKSVKELLEILEESKKHVPDNSQLFIGKDPYMPKHIVEWESLPEKPLNEHLGIAKELFPQEDKLTDEEVTNLVIKILEVWYAYHFVADLEEITPYREAYTKLLSVWDEEVQCLSEGYFHFDFYDPDSFIMPDNETIN